MGRLKYVFLPFVFMTMFALPLAAPAVDAALSGAPCVAEVPAAPPDDKCEGCKDKERKHRVRGIDDGAAFRVYSLMTGKKVEELKKTCEAGKVTIWQLARREGKLEALKKNMLEGSAAGLGELVKHGIMDSDQMTKILSYIKDELSKQQ